MVFVPALAFVSCRGEMTPLPRLPGHSDRPAGGPTVPAKSASAKVKWERWDEIATYRVALPRAVSQHFAGDHEGEVLANAAASVYPDLGPARALGEGAVLVERLYPAGGDAPDAILAMVRRPADAVKPVEGAGEELPFGWELVVVGPDGMVEERGEVEACARCHAEAPHDGVFGRAQ